MASFDANKQRSWARALRPPVRSTGARRIGETVSRVLLVTVFAIFAWANFSHWRTTGAPSGLGTTLLEGWAAALFLVRRATTQISVRPLAWVAALIGSFAMLLARPSGGGLPNLPCEVLQLVGVLVALISLGTLGRSFGIVAANRGLKTRGLYKFLRHPAYAGYVIAYLGYVAENPSLLNIALLCVSTAFQLVRIKEEERILASDPSYRRYRDIVRYRLIPFVY